MSLEITLSEGHSLPSLVRGAELVLALAEAAPQLSLRLRVEGVQTPFRHLMTAEARSRLRALEATVLPQGCYDRIWLGPEAAWPTLTGLGTWCLATDLCLDMRHEPMPTACHLMQLTHPKAADVGELGGVQTARIPLAVHDAMRSVSAQAPSGVCVVGSGDPFVDRAQVALIVRRTAGDVVFFDPYQHHSAKRLPGVKRIVAPCGPARRAMMYASCRYVISAAATLGFDDHFVFEAMTMGLLPLAAFAPADMAMSDAWDTHLISVAFGAAVAHTGRGAPCAASPATSRLQAQCVLLHLDHRPMGRPWGSKGSFGTVQYVRPDDVAQVHKSDYRAAVVICGPGTYDAAALRAWALRCDYQMVCVVGACGSDVLRAVRAAFVNRSSRSSESLSAGPAKTPILTTSQMTRALVVCLQERRSRPHLQFDVVHIGDRAAHVMHVRRLLERLDTPQDAASHTPPHKTTTLLTLVVCDGADAQPSWVGAWRWRWPHTWVVEVGELNKQDLEEADGHAGAIGPEDTWAMCRRLVSLVPFDLVLDAGAGGERLARLCAQANKRSPHVLLESHMSGAVGYDTALSAPLHQGACRLALGWPERRCVVLVCIPKAELCARDALQPALRALTLLCAAQDAVHVCVVAPQACPGDIEALEVRLDAMGLGQHVDVLGGPLDAFGPSGMAAHGASLRALVSAADVLLDGPWSAPHQRDVCETAMALGRPIVRWPGGSVDTDEDAAMPFGFRVDAAAHSDKVASLHAYLLTLCSDGALRERLGLCAQRYMRASRDSRAFAAGLSDKLLAECIDAGAPQSVLGFWPRAPIQHSAQASCLHLNE